MRQHVSNEKTVRLAEDDWVAVDLCPCGTLHLHLGALSLRLQPDAVSELMATLGLAVARRQMLRSGAAGTAGEGEGEGEGGPWGGPASNGSRGKT